MASEPIATLKLLIDRKRNRVIFAEVGKDFVDFLFHFFRATLGTITNLITDEHMVGSLGKMYASVQTLSTLFLEPHCYKHHILDPERSQSCWSLHGYLYDSPTPAKPQEPPKVFYRCVSRKYECSTYISDNPTLICPSCKGIMSTKIILITAKVPPTRNIYTDGYVKAEVTFMVKDDLEVKPMSGISSIALLNEFNLKNLEDLEEKKVCMSPYEGLMLLKASMQSKTVLTDVFLLRKPQVPNIADDEEDEDYLDEDEETDEDADEEEETDEPVDEDIICA